MQLGKSSLLNSMQQLKPTSRSVLTPDDADAMLSQRTAAMAATATMPACQLVHRNYFWLLMDGPGIVEQEYDYDDFFYPTPPKFDFLTVSLMGSNVVFSDQEGRPAPFPQALSWVNCGEIPETRRFWALMGFLDPFLDHTTGTVQLLPWSGAIQVGVFGWNFA